MENNREILAEDIRRTLASLDTKRLLRVHRYISSISDSQLRVATEAPSASLLSALEELDRDGRRIFNILTNGSFIHEEKLDYESAWKEWRQEFEGGSLYSESSDKGTTCQLCWAKINQVHYIRNVINRKRLRIGNICIDAYWKINNGYISGRRRVQLEECLRLFRSSPHSLQLDIAFQDLSESD